MRTLLPGLAIRQPLPAKLKGWALEGVLLLGLFALCLTLTTALLRVLHGKAVCGGDCAAAVK